MKDSFKGGDKYYWNEDTIVDLSEETKDMSKDSKTRFITEWVEDNCEVDSDLNDMVADLISKLV